MKIHSARRVYHPPDIQGATSGPASAKVHAPVMQTPSAEKVDASRASPEAPNAIAGVDTGDIYTGIHASVQVDAARLPILNASAETSGLELEEMDTEHALGSGIIGDPSVHDKRVDDYLQVVQSGRAHSRELLSDRPTAARIDPNAEVHRLTSGLQSQGLDNDLVDWVRENLKKRLDIAKEEAKFLKAQEDTDLWNKFWEEFFKPNTIIMNMDVSGGPAGSAFSGGGGAPPTANTGRRLQLANEMTMLSKALKALG